MTETVPPSPLHSPNFVAALPARGATDDYVRVLFRSGRLRMGGYGTRRGPHSISPELVKLLPAFGGLAYIAAKLFPGQRSESFRYRMHPWLDQWVQKQMKAGEHVISSYGYANACFRFARSTGGKTFLDAGNSHPQTFWEILSEEHQRWNCNLPPISFFQYQRALAMIEDLDYVLAPSQFVASSFLQRGFPADRIFPTFYPVDLRCFRPATEPRPASRPLTIISTGAVSLRKGAPYMLEAFRMVHWRHPSARFFLTDSVHDSMRPIMKTFSDLPIDWSPPLPHAQLAERLRSADIFVLPSLEEGLMRTALEAMSCGLPVVLTPHTGANDFVSSEEMGQVVPIRDAPAVAEAILKLADNVMVRNAPPQRHFNPEVLSFERFEENFLQCLQRIGI